MSIRPGDFTDQANAYSRARPGYPRDLIALLHDVLEFDPELPVAEIGSGTGIFTRLLAEKGYEVSAIEPNRAMADQAPPLPGVTRKLGTFEQTGLPSASHGWAVAAQAFHWAQPDLALPEIRRVIAPGGAFTVLWNNRDLAESEVLRWTRDLIEERIPDFDEGYRKRDWTAVLESTGDFEVVAELCMPHVVSMEKERYLDLWRSHHLLNTAAGQATMGELLAEISSRLGNTESIEIPYLCLSWSAIATT